LQFLGARKESTRRGKVVLLAGGDVRGSMCVATARILAAHDVDVTLVVLDPTDDVKQQLTCVDVDALFYDFPRDLDAPDLIIDALLPPSLAATTAPHALLGLSSDFKQALTWLKSVKTHKVSIDVPSGYCPDSGRAFCADPVSASWVLAMGLPKVGLLTMDKQVRVYLSYCGLTKSAVGSLFPGIESKWKNPFGDKFLVPLEIAERL